MERANRVIAVQLRRPYYAEHLTSHPNHVRELQFATMSFAQRLGGRPMWPVTRRLMIKECGPAHRIPLMPWRGLNRKTNPAGRQFKG